MVVASSADTRDWVALAPARGPALLAIFPYAGAGAGIFRTWSERLASSARVVVMRLPGRESRLSEPLVSDAETVARAIAPALAEHMTRPAVFYGHSVGALLAYLVAHELEAAGLPAPTALVVAARPAPQLLPLRPPIHVLGDDEFVRHVTRYGGTSLDTLEERELLELYLPTLRSDFALAETYRHSPRPPLAAPIVSVGGEADPEVTPEALRAWETHTNAGFRTLRVRGGHFPHGDGEDDILRCLSLLVRDAVAANPDPTSVIDGLEG